MRKKYDIIKKTVTFRGKMSLYCMSDEKGDRKMKDDDIIELFFKRSESAISECDAKYGKYCRAIAHNILGSPEDADEAVSDAYLAAWNTIPPHRPERLISYLGTLSRTKAIDKLRTASREKRGGSYDIINAELDDIVSGNDNSPVDKIALADALNSFLSSLDKRARVIFMKRYFWCQGISEIASSFTLSEGAVKMSLSRTRQKLKEHLIKEGFDL